MKSGKKGYHHLRIRPFAAWGETWLTDKHGDSVAGNQLTPRNRRISDPPNAPPAK